ncbi:MAG: RHS repeat domain-containing protein [Algibacter sp.]
MNMRFLSLAFSYFVFHISFGQEIHEIVPPTPTAASLAQFADVPVSSYTGLPNIGVPIYTIKSGPLSLPIDLRYHGGGIKVSQEASWVGLGWSLSAGGSISRVIRGNDDLFYEVVGSDVKMQFIYSVDMPDQGASQEDWDDYYDYLVNYGHDPEPDIFYYNFGSFSGKFVIEKPENHNQNEIVGNPLDAEAIKIIYFKDEGLWEITDPMGVKYEFSVPETTKTYSFSSGSLSLSDILSDKDALRTNDGSNPTPLITTWHLKEVTSPESDHIISLEYEEYQHETQGQIRISQSVAELYDQYITCGGSSTGTNPIAEPRVNSGSIDVTQDVYLSKINYSNGYVLFSTSDRIDLLSKSTTHNPQRLDSIGVYNTTDLSAIVTAIFDYDYFQKSLPPEKIPEYYRLKLSGVKIQDQNYEFTYNDPGILIPSKVSLSVDHWGYFNNADNQTLKRWAENDINTTNRPGTLIPGIDFKYTDYNGETHETYFKGADREANEDFTKYFILEEIKLPTGGTKTFEWEPNQYLGDKVENNFEYGSLSGCSNISPPPTNYETVYCESDEFEITDDSVELSLDFVAMGVLFNVQSFYYSNNFLGYLKWENDEWVQTRLYVDTQNINTTGYSLGGSTFNLTPGIYKIFINYQAELLTLNASWDYHETLYLSDTNIDGAGLRIKKISIDDGYNPIIRKFNYLKENQTKSSGLLMANLAHHYSTGIGYLTGQTNCLTSASFLLGTSNSVFSLSVRGNNHVGYNRVSSSYEGSENLGETISEYYNYEPYTTIPIIPPNYPMESDPRNGKPKSVTIKNGVGTNLEEKTYSYSVSGSYEKNTPGMFIFRSLLSNGINLGERFPAGMTFNQYPNYSKWCYLKNETNTRYDLNGTNPITTTTNYSYENEDHLQLTRTETVKSDGKKLITKIIYPDDVFTASTLLDNSSIEGGTLSTEAFNAIKRLKHPNNDATGLHRVAQPIQTNTYEDKNNDGIAETNELLSIQRTNYNDHGNDLVLPKDIQTLKGIYNSSTNQLQNRIIFQNYYDNGNLKEVSKKEGTTIVYIWGYNDEYPIAKIENASFSDIPTGLYDQVIAISNYDDDRTVGPIGDEGNLRYNFNILRNLSALSDAMVTTYTYDPLIGVTSVTDPKGYTMYYEYDDFNRLEQVKDADGNILSKNEYNYKQ